MRYPSFTEAALQEYVKIGTHFSLAMLRSSNGLGRAWASHYLLQRIQTTLRSAKAQNHETRKTLEELREALAKFYAARPPQEP